MVASAIIALATIVGEKLIETRTRVTRCAQLPANYISSFTSPFGVTVSEWGGGHFDVMVSSATLKCCIWVGQLHFWQFYTDNAFPNRLQVGKQTLTSSSLKSIVERDWETNDVVAIVNIKNDHEWRHMLSFC